MTPHQPPSGFERSRRTDSATKLGNPTFIRCESTEKRWVSHERSRHHRRMRPSHPRAMGHAWALGGSSSRVGARGGEQTSASPNCHDRAGDGHARPTLSPEPSTPPVDSAWSSLVGSRQQATTRSSRRVRATQRWRRQRASKCRAPGSSACAQAARSAPLTMPRSGPDGLFARHSTV